MTNNSSYKQTHFKNIQTGDVIFIKGKNSFIDIIIRFLSGSDFIHTAIIIEIRGLWFVIETRNSSSYGYQMVPLEWWFARHHQSEMYLGKMPLSNSKTTSNIRKTLMDSVESLRPYKTSWILLTYILQVWFGVFRPNINKLYNNSKPLICSTLVQEAWERAGVIEQTNYMTPGDLVNYIGGEGSLFPLQNENDKTNHQDLFFGDFSIAN